MSYYNMYRFRIAFVLVCILTPAVALAQAEAPTRSTTHAYIVDTLKEYAAADVVQGLTVPVTPREIQQIERMLGADFERDYCTLWTWHVQHGRLGQIKISDIGEVTYQEYSSPHGMFRNIFLRALNDRTLFPAFLVQFQLESRGRWRGAEGPLQNFLDSRRQVGASRLASFRLYPLGNSYIESFTVRNNEMGERVVRALEHLRTLCPKRSDDDPFKGST